MILVWGLQALTTDFFLTGEQSRVLLEALRELWSLLWVLAGRSGAGKYREVPPGSARPNLAPPDRTVSHRER